MHIAIDARLNAYRQGGIPQYTRQLLTALAEVARDDRLTSLQHRDQLRPLAVAPNVVRRTLLTPPHHRLEQWTLPLELLLVRPDVLHCPDFIAPLRRSCPAVVTIHDLAFMHYPEILDDAARAYYGQIRTNAPRADAIIAVSEATRQDIAQFLDIPIEEIDVIHEAPAPLYGRLELRPGEARVLNATPVAAGTFMLFVSTLEPRKNLPTLLQALRVCLDRRPERRYLLVVVGARGWRDEAIFETVRDLRLGDHVLFAGSVGQYDLRWLYNACRFYINPSLYEGFGLPLVEAMACGAACLAAATSSLPEIGGDAAIYVPPLDAGLWAEAIEELWDDEERQQELGRLGRVQAQHFSWVRAARETLKVYERAVERSRPKPATPFVPARVERRGAMERGALGVEEEPVQAALEREPGAIPWASGEARTCLRCGTPMLEGQLQRGITIKRPAAATDHHPLAPRAWACPRCGLVELVVEQVETVQAKLGEPDVTAEGPAPEEPGAGEEQAVGGADAPIVPVVASEGPAPEEPEVGEEQAVGGADAPIVPVVAADEKVLVEPAAGPPMDEAASLDGRPDQDVALTEASAPVLEFPADAEQPEQDVADTSMLNGSPGAPPDHPDQPIHSALIPTEFVTPPRAADGESSSSQPAKRRQTRSKRKRS